MNSLSMSISMVPDDGADREKWKGGKTWTRLQGLRSPLSEILNGQKNRPEILIRP
jgi:hypothetical protein